MTDNDGIDARFVSLYEENYSRIRDYCLRRLSANDAADAAAEIFTVAWRKVDVVPTEADDARRWLYGVARNVVAHHRRGHARRDRLERRLHQTLDAPEPSADVPVVRRSEDARVFEAMQNLKESDQEVLRLKLWEELSHSDIAAVLGVSAHAVDMRVRRATRRLGRLLASPRRTYRRAITEGGEA